MKGKFKVPLLMTCASLVFTQPALAMSHTGYGPTDALSDPYKRPNIVLILADDLGFTDLGAFGSEIQTPHIDQLAREGLKFSNYHTSASCAPSRAMLLTGVDNHLAGLATIPESMAPEQEGLENYAGVLSHKVVTVASILNEGGYHTYMAGKWHLGKEEDQLPYYRGFERTLAMGDTGADNYEQRPYMPIYDQAHWTRDGKAVQLKEPFYSSELLVDEMIGFIDSNLDDGKPFFAYVPFLAVHLPVQAPKAYTDLYMNTYTEGWEVLREDRHESAMAVGLVPESTRRVSHDFIDDWEALSEEEKAFEAKRMAVYAGMVTAMDEHIGRLVHYLEESGQLENTVFIITSDNGPEYSTLPKSTIQAMGYTHNYSDLGEIGSFSYIDKNFANAAASPLSFFKFYAGEGGLRVPLIISGPGIERHDGFIDAFTHVTDITPTILSLAEVEAPGGRFGGRAVYPITGKDMSPLLEGSRDHIYGPDDYVGYEVAGNIALYNGDYKLVMNRGPLGDSAYYMFDIIEDPGETEDLKAENPVQFQHMLNLYGRYARDKGVEPVPEHYNQDMEIVQKSIRNSNGKTLTLFIFVLVTALIFTIFGVQRRKTLKKNS